MEDYLVRALTASENIRALTCVTGNLAREACARHHTSPLAAVALSRALTGGALLGALLKTGQRVALKFEGNGPLAKIIVEADSNGAVRGYVANPQAELPLTADGLLDVAGGLGRAGFLTVTKDLRLREPYRGMVQLYTSEIGEDLAYYLLESEQIPSAVGVGVVLGEEGGIQAAGGFLIQSLPPADEAAIAQLVQRIGQLPTLSSLLRDGSLPEELLALLLGDLGHTILEKRALAFSCSCSRERLERALLSLGREELESIVADLGEAKVSCEFCRAEYLFSRSQLAQLIKELSAH